MAEVIGAQLAVMTQNWTEEQTADAVDCYLNYIADTVKECRAVPIDKEEEDKMVKELLNVIGEDNGVEN